MPVADLFRLPLLGAALMAGAADARTPTGLLSAIMQSLRPTRYTDYYPSDSAAQQGGGAVAKTDQQPAAVSVLPTDSAVQAVAAPQAPTLYQQITGTAPTSKPGASRQKATSKSKGTSKKQAQVQVPETAVVLPKSVGNPDWHDVGNSVAAQDYANAIPIQRSAGMSPDTSHGEAAAIANAAQAEMDAANQAAFDNRYNQLLAMYGIAPDSGAPKVDQNAAMQYYGDQAIYDALARAYSGTPITNAWGR